ADLLRTLLREHGMPGTVVPATGQGISDALNQALRIARSDYVARMDQDDESLPERFARQVESLDADEKLSLVSCFVENVFPPSYPADSRRGAEAYEERRRAVTLGGEDVRAALLDANLFYHPEVMMRRRVVLGVGGYRRGIDVASDYDLFLRLSEVSLLTILSEVAFRKFYDVGNASFVHGDVQETQADLIKVLARIRGLGVDDEPYLPASDTEAELEDCLRRARDRYASERGRGGE
ncbi:glycosyltransferase, partial [Paenibacillus apiarius]|nr:glycosyltransferase [Paenibacillus apiarius]